MPMICHRPACLISMLGVRGTIVLSNRPRIGRLFQCEPEPRITTNPAPPGYFTAASSFNVNV